MAKKCGMLTLWFFFSMASCLSFISTSSLSLLSFLFSLTRLDLVEDQEGNEDAGEVDEGNDDAEEIDDYCDNHANVEETD